MILEELKDIARECGVVGAGGAGFPSYAKLTDRADTVILNCVECEPLLKLHRQLLALYAPQIVKMLDTVRDATGAREAVIGIKGEYTETIEALIPVTDSYEKVRIHKVDAAYPMGDEVILIYETTGRVIKPGGLPIDENVIVFNVETMYNLYMAITQHIGVSDKLVSVVGAVDTPKTIRVPLGMSAGDVVKAAGNITVDEYAFLIGGPMMGYIGRPDTVVTKTCNAIIVLPRDHKLVQSANKDLGIEKRRASSACCQCRTCTDLCSRHAIGHPVEPHRIMRSVANNDLSDLSVFKNAMYCSGCGICEKYACPQGLSPASILQEFKKAQRAAGIPVEKINPKDPVAGRSERKVPVHRLTQRLGLARYDKNAPIDNTCIAAKTVRIPVGQHIGIPSEPVVNVGDTVKKGQLIGKASQGLSVNIHSSIDGRVTSVDEFEITITSSKE